MRFFAFAISLALVAVACSSDAAAPVVTQELTTTTAEPTTTQAPETTTTTAPEPTEAELEAQLEAELVAVIAGADSVFLLDPIDPDTPLIDEFYTEDFGDAFSDTLRSRSEAGDSYTGAIELLLVNSVEASDESALLVACVFDGVVAIDSGGDPLSEVDETAYIVAYEFQAGPGSWLLDGIYFPGPEKSPCDAP